MRPALILLTTAACALATGAPAEAAGRGVTRAEVLELIEAHAPAAAVPQTAVYGQASSDGVGVMGQSAGGGGTAVVAFAPQGRGIMAQANNGPALRLFPQTAPATGATGDTYVDSAGNLFIWSTGQWRRVQFAP